MHNRFRKENFQKLPFDINMKERMRFIPIKLTFLKMKKMPMFDCHILFENCLIKY